VILTLLTCSTSVPNVLVKKRGALYSWSWSTGIGRDRAVESWGLAPCESVMLNPEKNMAWDITADQEANDCVYSNDFDSEEVFPVKGYKIKPIGSSLPLRKGLPE